MRIKKTSFALMAAMGILAGCEVGPDYKQAPQIPVMSAYGQNNDIALPSTRPERPISVVTTQPVQVTEWWSTFNDPELNSLVARAAKNNLDLKNAGSRLRQARAQRGVVGSDLLPQINADGGYQRARGSSNVTLPAGLFGLGGSATPAVATPSVVKASPLVATPAVTAAPAAAPTAPLGGPASPLGLGGLPGVDTELYQAGFDASWEIDVFGGQRRAVEAADDDTAAAIEDRRDVLVSMVAEVARNYVELRGYQREEAIARANLQSEKETLDLTRSRFKAGFVTQLDVARAAYEVANTASMLPGIEASVRMSIHQLGILLGQDPESLMTELLPPAGVPAVPAEVPIGLPSDLLRRRPDIRRAERQIASATAHIGVATSDLFPKLSLTGQFGLDSTKVKNLPDWSSRYFALSPGVSWPIFDAGRINNNIHVQDELEKQAETNYEITVLNALGEVEDALTRYRSEQVRNKALADAVEQAQLAVDLAKQQYEQGVIDFLTVLDAQRSLLSAQDVQAQSDSAISTDLVAIYKAMGGGWEVALPQKK